MLTIAVGSATETYAAAPAEIVIDPATLVLAHETGENVPVRDREMISLALGVCALVLVVANRRRLAQVPGAGWWLAALLTRESAWAFAVFDGMIGLEDAAIVETSLLTISTSLMAVGAWRTFALLNGGEVRP